MSDEYRPLLASQEQSKLQRPSGVLKYHKHKQNCSHLCAEIVVITERKANVSISVVEATWSINTDAESSLLFPNRRIRFVQAHLSEEHFAENTLSKQWQTGLL